MSAVPWPRVANFRLLLDPACEAPTLAYHTRATHPAANQDNPRKATADDLRAYFDLADQLIAGASKEAVAEAARLLALNVAHYQLKYGALPLENFADMLRAQTINSETAELLAAGMENLVGVLGIVMGLDGDHGATDIH
jgi:hypothetical protein